MGLQGRLDELADQLYTITNLERNKKLLDNVYSLALVISEKIGYKSKWYKDMLVIHKPRTEVLIACSPDHYRERVPTIGVLKFLLEYGMSYDIGLIPVLSTESFRRNIHSSEVLKTEGINPTYSVEEFFVGLEGVLVGMYLGYLTNHYVHDSSDMEFIVRALEVGDDIISSPEPLKILKIATFKTFKKNELSDLDIEKFIRITEKDSTGKIRMWKIVREFQPKLVEEFHSESISETGGKFECIYSGSEKVTSLANHLTELIESKGFETRKSSSCKMYDKVVSPDYLLVETSKNVNDIMDQTPTVLHETFKVY